MWHLRYRAESNNSTKVLFRRYMDTLISGTRNIDKKNNIMCFCAKIIMLTVWKNKLYVPQVSNNSHKSATDFANTYTILSTLQDLQFEIRAVYLDTKIYVYAPPPQKKIINPPGFGIDWDNIQYLILIYAQYNYPMGREGIQNIHFLLNTDRKTGDTRSS